jgi:hypothetical protein
MPLNIALNGIDQKVQFGNTGELKFVSSNFPHLHPKAAWVVTTSCGGRTQLWDAPAPWVRKRNEARIRWATIPVQIRNGCESDARSPGTSYLDLLTCMEMSEET